MALVSVIMPVYNGEKYLAEAIDSILVQTFTDFELLIVDDGSQDGSAEIIRSYEKRDRRIRFFQLEENMGAATARNRGISAAGGEYVTSMDCDDVSLPERLQKQVDFLQSNPNIGGLGTCARMVHEDLKTTIGNFNVPQQHAHIALNMFVGASFVGATVMLRRHFLMLSMVMNQGGDTAWIPSYSVDCYLKRRSSSPICLRACCFTAAMSRR